MGRLIHVSVCNFSGCAVGIPVLRRLVTRDVATEGHWYDPDGIEHRARIPGIIGCEG